MDMNKARILLYAIDSGSLTKTAAAFDYTPSGISHMMASLEAEVGFPLLIRTKRGVSPTENARRLLPVIRSLFEWDDYLRQSISEINGLAQGTLRIGTYASIADQWLPKVLARFHGDYPNIRIELHEGGRQEIEDELLEHRADLGFYSYRPGIRHQWVPLGTDPVVVAVPPGHRLAAKAAVRLRELAEETWIVPASGADADIRKLLKEENARPRQQLSARQDSSALRMVEQGMGVFLTNRLTAAGSERALKLLPLNPPMERTLGMAIPIENRKIPAVSKFAAYAAELLQSN